MVRFRNFRMSLWLFPPALAILLAVPPAIVPSVPADAADAKTERRNRKQAAAEKKAAEARHQALAGVERQLGRKEEGHFLLALKATAYTHIKGSRTTWVPDVTYTVVIEDGRQPAAERIAKFMTDINHRWQNTVKAYRAGDTFNKNDPPPPRYRADWKLLQRFEDPLDANTARTLAERKFNVQSSKLNSAARRQAGAP